MHAPRRRLAGPVRAARRVAPTAAIAAALLLWPAGSAAAKRDFPRGFQWGVATAGFQTEMGRGRNLDRRSDWWVWTHDPQNIAAGTVTSDRPERGPGFLARYRRDIALAAGKLHLNAFRLGIEWSRIFPRSTAGATTLKQLDRLANHRALRRYRRILKLIRARGMTPWVTLNHFTLPLWIQDPIAARDAFAGVGPDDPPPSGFGPRGWLDTSTVGEFRKYAAYLAWKLGPLVNRWMTLNEPMVVVVNGYVNVPGVVEGDFPPGAYNYPAAIAVVQNLADANAAAYDAVHRHDRRARVGFVHNMVAFTPANPASAEDRAGTEHAEYLFDRLFLDAAVKGYRDANGDGVIQAGERHPELAHKADFVGVNYYFRGRVTGLGVSLTPTIPVLDFLPSTGYRTAANPSAPLCPTICSDFGNEIYPAGFRRVLAIAGRYGRPVYVTENGISDANDDQRPAFLRSHLRAMRAAIRSHQARVRGYFHWSLTDNFEWAAGYRQHFGLYRFNPRTLKRIPRRHSVRLYGRVARTGRIP
jgi:beta-galactosidase